MSKQTPEEAQKEAHAFNVMYDIFSMLKACGYSPKAAKLEMGKILVSRIMTSGAGGEFRVAVLKTLPQAIRAVYKAKVRK